MYLDNVEIENFRLFGSRGAGRQGHVKLQPGINLIVGPNDAGKTCLIDSIRLLVGTVTADYFPITEDDFHISDGQRATQLSVVGVFRGISVNEAGAFLEYLGTEEIDGKQHFYLRLRLVATLQDPKNLSPRKRRIRVELRAGPDPDGIRFDGQARELLAATYLKPLRDAVNELAARRGSRLSQILRAYHHIDGHDTSDWEPDNQVEPKTLIGIAQKADYFFRNTDVIQKAEAEINDHHLGEFSIGDTPLKGRIEASGQELRHILERLELSLSDAEANTCRGLGVYNLLFIATELLALAPTEDSDLPLLLIEEPEAHLHPQYQQRLIEYIRRRTKTSVEDGRKLLQVLLTTHSPHLASQVPLRHLTLMHCGKAYSLQPSDTKLDASDYAFLERFLDVTKANLFFASGIIVVEGDAEALLLPVLAKKIGRPLDRYGVSIVNVGHTGLFRYSRIFQRLDEESPIPVRVSCITDRDIPPAEAADLISDDRRTADKYTPEEIESHIKTLKHNDGQNVNTFTSPCWTLEHDLAAYGLGKIVHIAICLAKKAKSLKTFPMGTAFDDCVNASKKEYRSWQLRKMRPEEIAVRIYTPLAKRQATKTEAAQALAMLIENHPVKSLRPFLPQYLVDAIDFATGAGPK